MPLPPPRYACSSANVRRHWRKNRLKNPVQKAGKKTGHNYSGMILRKRMKHLHTGFSAIEMMVVVAIIAILAMIAIPSSMDKIIKEQVNAAMPLADIAKTPIAASWSALKILPPSNKEAGLPEPEKVVSNF